MRGKLYGSEKSFRTQKVLIAAKLANIEITLAGEKPPHDSFPLGITPAFEDGNTKLFGAESIAMHIAGNTFKTSNCSEVLQWLQWAEGSLLPNILAYVLPSVSAAHVDNKSVERARTELLAQLTHLNAMLQPRTFLVGERISLADISVALDLLPAYQYVLDEATRAPLVNVNRWYKTIINQPAVKEVLGDFTFATEIAHFDQAKFEELSTKHTNKKNFNRESHRGEQKPQHKAAPRKEKEGHKKEEPLDEDEEIHANEPKTVDPFLKMPKGTFDMDAFKRVYSNEDTATKAIPYFWEHFDTSNYSIWFAEYNYPNELTLSFMSCNLINGMFQRLEKLKKNAFASVCLFGTDNNSSISGVWFWRGQELVFPLCPDWMVDYESYTWTKMDPADEKTKKVVNEYLMWEGDFDGKKFNQGKIFK